MMCALECYYPSDIAQGIAAVTVAMLSASAATGVNVEYVRGVIDTARAQALNYGIPWAGLAGQMREALGARGDLLELVARMLPGG